MPTINPTIGRKVYFFEPAEPIEPTTRYDDKVPFDATIVYVWSKSTVNLRVTDHAGNVFTRTSVPLRDPGPMDRHGQEYVATWMPFQVGQAKQSADVGSVGNGA